MGMPRADSLEEQDAKSQRNVGARCEEQFLFRCEMQRVSCIKVQKAKSKLLSASVSSVLQPAGHSLSLPRPWGCFLGAGWEVAGGILCHRTSAQGGFPFADTALAARGKWQRQQTTRTASWALPTTPALEVRLPCPSLSPRGTTATLAVLMGSQCGWWDAVPPSSARRECPPWCPNCRGLWGRMGDMRCKGLPLNMFWGGNLAVRMHVDQGCGGFIPKVHSCSWGGRICCGQWCWFSLRAGIGG